MAQNYPESKSHLSQLSLLNFESPFSIMSTSYISEVEDADEVLGNDVQQHWLISAHCSDIVFPAIYPEIVLSTRSCNYYYLQHATSGIPDQELVKTVRQAYYRVLSKLNQKKLQVRNFILPVQLMLLKFIDPYSRQRIVEDMCKYLSLQSRLRSVVLEQAALSLDDLIRILLALSSSGIRKLYLWNVLDKCQLPFKGPLQCEFYLDNPPRIPYTFNPGGRKFLKKLRGQRDFEREKSAQNGIQNTEQISTSRRTRGQSGMVFPYLMENEIENANKAAGRKHSVSANENYEKLLILMSSSEFQGMNEREIISRMDVAVQCDMSRGTEGKTQTQLSCENHSYGRTKTSVQLMAKVKTDFFKEYLKKYENCDIEITILRDIFKFALAQLVNLTTLSINYGMLADGTGEALLAVGSLTRGRLRELELLCQLHELPVAEHNQYDWDATHAIPDATWTRVKEDCPLLKVRFVCVNMMTNDVTKKYLTRSIPLNSLHLDCGFCPTLVTPQIAFFSTLKCLHIHYKDTIEHLSLVMWHTSGRIDSSLERFMLEAPHLRSFEYFGPVQYIATVRQLCETALKCPKLERFSLMVQGDPCHPEMAREVAADVRRRMRHKFADRGVQFQLGTHNSSTTKKEGRV